MSATPTLLSRNGRRSGTGRGVNSLGKKDVGCATNGVVAETLDGRAEPYSRGRCIASYRKSAHDSAKSEDEIAGIKDELKEYKKQIDALREDLKIVVKLSAPRGQYAGAN